MHWSEKPVLPLLGAGSSQTVSGLAVTRRAFAEKGSRVLLGTLMVREKEFELVTQAYSGRLGSGTMCSWGWLFILANSGHTLETIAEHVTMNQKDATVKDNTEHLGWKSEVKLYYRTHARNWTSKAKAQQWALPNQVTRAMVSTGYRTNGSRQMSPTSESS